MDPEIEKRIKEWDARKDEEAKEKLAQLEEAYPRAERILDLEKQHLEKQNKKRLAELETEASTIPTIETLTTKELLTIEFPPVRYLIQDLIASRGFTAITGAPFSYKSFLSLYFCVCIASGKLVFDKFPVEQGAILIVDKENQLVTLQERLRMLNADSNLPIFFLKMPDNYDISNKGMMEWTKNFCIQNKVKLILFDSLIHIHKGNENDSDAIRSTFTLLKQLPTAKMFITHHRKPGRFDVGTVLDRIRGSSDIGAELENHIALDVFSDKLKITQGKNRGGILQQPFLVKPIFIDQAASFEYIGEATEEISKVERAKQMIINHFGTGQEFERQEAIQTFAGEIGEKNIDRALKTLETEEIITARFEGRKKVYLMSQSMSQTATIEISPLEQSYLQDAE